MPEPWQAILDGLTGPYGVIVALSVVVYFLWRLFRESQHKEASAWDHAREAVQVTKDLTTEVKAWREASKK